MLLKDGVKYSLYEYVSEEELAQAVTKYCKEIFGADTLYFDPQAMKTHVGINVRNDGIILAPDKKQWYILEVELAEHSLHRHIIPQVTKFNIAYQQPETKRKLTDALYNLIRQDPYKTAALQTQKIEDIHKHLTEIIDTPPTIAIIIDQKTPEVDAVCKNLPFKTRTTEFKTYTRENAINVCIHAFEQLYEEPTLPKGLLNVLTVLEQIYKKDKTYEEAAAIAAKKLKITEKAIRHDCTTDLGLKSTQFRKLIQNKQRLNTLLTEKYPDYETTIKETIR